MGCHRQAHSDFQNCLLSLKNEFGSKDLGDDTNHIKAQHVRGVMVQDLGHEVLAKSKTG